MSKNNVILMALIGLLTLAVSSVFALMVIDSDGGVDAGFSYLDLAKAEKYATFLTLATFDGISEHKCLGRTALCPDQCGHSGEMATFTIDKTLAYGRYNEYGDTRTETFQVLIKNNLNDTPLIPQDIYDQIKSLKKGARVLLSWNHNYVTIEGSSAPERPINFIYPLTAEQANMVKEVTVLSPVADVSSRLTKYTVFVGTYSADGMFGDILINDDKNKATFIVFETHYTFHLADFVAAIFQFAYHIDLTTANESIVNSIKELKNGQRALVGYRVDQFFAGDQVLAEVTTPLFVLPFYGGD